MSDITFRKRPDFGLLTALADCDLDTQVGLSFDHGFELGLVSEVAQEDWSHSIDSARLASDRFCEDSSDWFAFGNLKSLTVSASLPDTNQVFDVEALAAFQRGVSEGMRNLESLTTLLECGEHAFAEAQSYLSWPNATFVTEMKRGRFAPGRRFRESRSPKANVMR
ncbi:hypothetical protein [Shimia sp. MIT1388]|uniref:hypothetical protein n=1 Tax=Shimia sp. MIT1388 TaxID=3096992 RepID=UPI00399B9065